MEKIIDSVLSGLKSTSQVLAHCSIVERSKLSCVVEREGSWTVLSSEVSSANMNISVIIDSEMSLIKVINKRGPSTDPCGTPAGTRDHLDDWPLITTRCCLLDR